MCLCYVVVVKSFGVIESECVRVLDVVGRLV